MTTSGRADKIGYARVSTAGQKLDAQLDALTQAGCLKIFTDQVSGARAARPGWELLRAYWRPSDTVVVTEFSRLSRSLAHLLARRKSSHGKVRGSPARPPLSANLKATAVRHASSGH